MVPWFASARSSIQCGVPKTQFQSLYSRLGPREAAAADGPGTRTLPPSLLGVVNGVLASWLLPGPALAFEAARGEKQCMGHRKHSCSLSVITHLVVLPPPRWLQSPGLGQAEIEAKDSIWCSILKTCHCAWATEYWLWICSAPELSQFGEDQQT